MGSCCCRSNPPKVHSINPSPTPEKVVYTPPKITHRPPTPTPTPPSSRSTILGRYNKIGISKTDPLLLIAGYEREPIVSLEEALEPFLGKIPHLKYQISEAKSNCRHPSKHHLTSDESAALYLYLIIEDEDTVHHHLQMAWDKNNRTQMKPWLKYLKLLSNGLNKLPDTTLEVWQGMSGGKDMQETLQSDSSPLYTAMGLGSSSMKQVKSDLQGETGYGTILVGYDRVDGKDVTDYVPPDQKANQKSNQKEVFIWPGVKLNKTKREELDSDGRMIIHTTGRKPKAIHFVCPMEDHAHSCTTFYSLHYMHLSSTC
jgi:hypothetical protein